MIDTEPSGSTLTGTATATTGAAALPSFKCREVLVQNDPGSAVNLIVGDSSNQKIVLSPGQSITLPFINSNMVYHKSASSTATVNFIARA